MLRELIAVGVFFCVIFVAGWEVNGWRKDTEIATIKSTYEKQRADAENAARAKEQTLQAKADQLLKDKNAQLNTVNNRLGIALTGLRSRPERTSPTAGIVSTATGTCSGLSGSELARGDGEFLAGYAADAARLEAALKQCEAQYNQLRN